MKLKLAILSLGFLLISLSLSGCAPTAIIYLDITANKTYFNQAGEEITFTYTITNGGDASLRNILFNSQPSRIFGCPADLSLSPAASKSCTFVYKVTSEDITVGVITIEDTVTAKYKGGCCGGACGGNDRSTSSSDQISLLYGEQLLLELSIQSQPESFTNAGQEIQYEFHIQNTGNINSSEPILIQDSLLTGTCPTGNIAPGEEILCSADYTSTVADVVSGVIRNTASASSGGVLSEEVTHEVPFISQPALSLAITTNPIFYSAAGDSIAFTYEVTNTGNVILDGPFTINSESQISWNCPETETLSPGSSLACSSTYQISQSDFGFDLTHSAIATGKWNTLVVESLPASIIIPFNLPPPPQQITISGNAGVAGATLSYPDGSPRTVTADGSGNYSLNVSYNWSGTVTPSKTGYTFAPTKRTYTNLYADQTGQDYTALADTFTISGNTGLAGVTLSYLDGTGKTAITDGSGNYSLIVSKNWSGTVTPSKTGYTFTPTKSFYTNVVANKSNQDYTAEKITFTISGNAGVAGAILSYTEGTARTVTADGSGNYSLTVSYDWSGTVTPSKTGYTFNPIKRTYANLTANKTNQDYAATAITPTISGNAGVAGATLSYTDGTARTVTADGSGNYSLSVSYGWSGTVTPSKTGYTFSPSMRTYTNIVDDKSNQDYAAAAVTFTISGNAGVAGATLSYTDGIARTVTADGSGSYSLTVSYDWSGTVTPSKTGYTFTPIK
ncbi:MAG: hypothetical protein ABIJ65_15740, partial [Chloroflexota bacterium]